MTTNRINYDGRGTYDSLLNLHEEAKLGLPLTPCQETTKQSVIFLNIPWYRGYYRYIFPRYCTVNVNFRGEEWRVKKLEIVGLITVALSFTLLSLSQE